MRRRDAVGEEGDAGHRSERRTREGSGEGRDREGRGRSPGRRGRTRRQGSRRRRHGGGAAILVPLALWVAGAPAAEPLRGQERATEFAAVAQFRGGPTHPGVAAGPGPETLGGVAWRFDTDAPVRASPVIHRDRVYVGSSDRRFYALDAETGRELWRYEAGAEIAGAAAATDARVVFVDRANTVHALDPGSGAVRWRVEAGPDLPLPWGHEGWDYLLASPTVVDGTVVVGTGDGVLRALSLADGRERWRFATGGRIRSAPAVVDGVAYVGSGDGIVYGVSMDDGREVWRFETEGVGWDAADFGFDRRQIYASPAIVDGVLYVGSRDAADYAVDLATGQAIWTYREGSPWVMASPAVGPERVYTGRSSGGAVLALDRGTGEPVWQHQTGGLVFSSPLLVDGVVYVGSADGALYAFDAATGDVRWRYRTDGGVLSSPVLWRGRLVFGSQDGAVYALRGGEATPRRAVYWDDDLMAGAAWGADEGHRAAADYFAARDYELLDAAGLEAFLAEAGTTGPPGVLVVAMDRVPASALDGGAASPLRRYLERGGKVVWMGALPGVFTRNEEGAINGVDRTAPGALLDVDVSAWDTDEQYHMPTDEGRRWGLEDGWMGWPGGDAAVPGLTPLAVDDLGRAGMWVRRYGGPVGTGFVLARPSAERPVLRQLRRVAEYGVMDDAAAPGG